MNRTCIICWLQLICLVVHVQVEDGLRQVQPNLPPNAVSKREGHLTTNTQHCHEPMGKKWWWGGGTKGVPTKQTL